MKTAWKIKGYVERSLGTHKAVCDACDRPVGFASGPYICLNCMEQLTTKDKLIVDGLWNYPSIRREFIRQANKHRKAVGPIEYLREQNE